MVLGISYIMAKFCIKHSYSSEEYVANKAMQNTMKEPEGSLEGEDSDMEKISSLGYQDIDLLESILSDFKGLDDSEMLNFQVVVLYCVTPPLTGDISCLRQSHS